MSENKKLPDAAAFKEEVLKQYPPKVARKRSKQFQILDGSPEQEIQANVRTVPGIITQRGCCYAGCKGVVLGPTRDIVNMTHGPIGCAFYSWLTRRNQTKPDELGPDNYMPYAFSTDMQDSNIVFGGEKKLKEAIQEAYDLFHPKGISIFSTCPIGLIGDDVHAAAKEMKEKFGDCNVFGFSCEGYKGVSQSAGHHIANNQIFKHVIGLNDTAPEGKYKINMLGEYNIGGDAFEIERLLDKCGFTLVSTFSGNSCLGQFERAHTADLSVVMCHRSINYVASMLEEKYGIPWFKVNFIGADATAKSLKKLAEYFEDPELIEKVNKVCEEEMASVKKAAAEVKPKTEGKMAMMFVGGSRAHHYQELFAEIGMSTMAAGYEFAHRDDYEGRQALPKIKLDADSRNIEELTITPDEKLYNPRKSAEKIEEMKGEGFTFNDYTGMIPDMPAGTMAIDDISHYEMEKLLEVYKPDIFCAGIKEKYAVQKFGIPLKQLHSYDYGGPYAGFVGAVNFYREIERMTTTKVWGLIKAPWDGEPELHAELAGE